MSNEEQNKVSEEVQKIVDEKGAQFEACLLKALQIAENTEGHNPKVKFHDEQVTTWAQSIFNDIGRDLRGKSIEASKKKNPGGNRFPRFNVPSKTGGYGASAGKSGSGCAGCQQRPKYLCSGRPRIRGQRTSVWSALTHRKQ